MSSVEPAVRTLLDALPAGSRRRLTALRSLIYAAASEAAVGPLQETLKWGDPAYLPVAPRTGTTVRMNAVKGSSDVALFFHCQTTLVPTFRELYGERLRFAGNRAILVEAASPLPEAELKHCIQLALTYHRRPKA